MFDPKFKSDLTKLSRSMIGSCWGVIRVAVLVFAAVLTFKVGYALAHSWVLPTPMDSAALMVALAAARHV